MYCDTFYLGCSVFISCTVHGCSGFLRVGTTELHQQLMEEGKSGNAGDESDNNLNVCLLVHVISQIFDGIDSSSLTHMLPILGYTMTHHD